MSNLSLYCLCFGLPACAGVGVLDKLSYILYHRKIQIISTKTTATNSCAIKASETINLHPSYSLEGLRTIKWSTLHVSKRCIGRGVFGKCYIGRLAHIEVCVKVFRKGYEHCFPAESHMLLQCNHINLPWIYGGVTEVNSPKAIVMSFHGSNANSSSLYLALSTSALSSDQAKTVIIGLMSATKYLHESKILHNDIKSDNILVEYASSSAKGVLVDLGKACYLCDGKRYDLSKEEKEKYSQRHPQIAPDLRDGHCSQSFASDIYSIGRVLNEVNQKILELPVVNSYSNMCREYLCSNRPSTNDLYKSLHFVLSSK